MGPLLTPQMKKNKIHMELKFQSAYVGLTWKKLYHHPTNKTLTFNLDTELAKYNQNISVQPIIMVFSLHVLKRILWCLLLPQKNFIIMHFNLRKSHLQDESYIGQFLRIQSLDFEAVRAALTNREVSLDLDTCIQVVLCLKEKKKKKKNGTKNLTLDHKGK